jgi:hypothetical protein
MTKQNGPGPAEPATGKEQGKEPTQSRGSGLQQSSGSGTSLGRPASRRRCKPKRGTSGAVNRALVDAHQKLRGDCDALRAKLSEGKDGEEVHHKMWTPANLSAAFDSAKDLDVRSPEVDVRPSCGAAFWRWQRYAIVLLLAAAVPGDDYALFIVALLASALRLGTSSLCLLLSWLGVLQCSWKHRVRLGIFFGQSYRLRWTKTVRCRTSSRSGDQLKKSWDLDDEVVDHRDLRVTNQRHVRMDMPSSLFDFQAKTKYRTVVEKFHGRRNHWDEVVRFRTKGPSEPETCEKLRASVALLGELSDSDLFGVNADREVAFDRIKAKLRSVKNVNLDRFAEFGDHVYLGTEYLARIMWMDRAYLATRLPSF